MASAAAVTMALGGCAQPKMESYLFAYFTGNAPEEEQICFALSDDGYNYTLLNDGEPIINSADIARKKCVRDPHNLLHGRYRHAQLGRMEQQRRTCAPQE